MPVELENKTDGSIPVFELKDGQIAIICEGKDKGVLVQRYENDIVILGQPSVDAWNESIEEFAFPVIVLKNGTKLTITDNE